MKITLAALLLLPLFAVSSRAADAPKPDNTQKCIDLRAKYDKNEKHPFFRGLMAKHDINEMKKLGCTNLPPEPTKK